MSGASVHLVLAGAGRRRDLTVPADVTLRELLVSSGIDVGRVGVVGAAGDPLDLDAALGDATPDGSLLWIYDGSAAGRAALAAREARRRQRPDTARASWQAAGIVAVAVAATAAAVIHPAGAAVAVAAALLGAAALALVLHPRAEGSDALTLLAPVLGFAAGACAASPLAAPQAVVATAAIAGAAVACVRHGRAMLRQQAVLPVTGISAVLWVAVALVIATMFLAGMPAHAAPALFLAAAPLLFRALAPTSVPIEEEDLLDMPFVIRDAPSVRGGTPRPPRRVRRSEVEATIRDAGRRRDAGALVLGALTATSAWWLLAVTPTHTIGGWCAVGGVAAVAAFLALWSRTAHRGAAKTVAILSAIGTLVPLVAHVLPLIPLSPLVTALALALSGLLAVALMRPVHKGWRSLGWSRAGDILEGFCVALAPAALLYASGIIDEIGRRIA